MSDPGWPRPRKPYNPDNVPYTSANPDPAKTRMLPDLWILDSKSWLNFQPGRSTAAFHERLCAVCGERMDGCVLLGAFQDPENRETSGPGCHPRCMVLAVQFCPHFKSPPDDQVVCFRYDGGGDGSWWMKKYGPPDSDDYASLDFAEPYQGPTYVSAAATPVTRAELKQLAKTDPMGVEGINRAK